MPYSVNDSAVCYYYEPDILTPGNSFSYIIYLTTEDITWYQPHTFVEPQKAAVEMPAEPIVEPIYEEPPFEEPVIEPFDDPVYMEPVFEETVYEDTAPQGMEGMSLYDVQRIREYQQRLNQFINGEIDLTEQELIEIETSLEQHGIRQQQN
jgi:hypothetical protein